MEWALAGQWGTGPGLMWWCGCSVLEIQRNELLWRTRQLFKRALILVTSNTLTIRSTLLNIDIEIRVE